MAAVLDEALTRLCAELEGKKFGKRKRTENKPKTFQPSHGDSAPGQVNRVTDVEPPSQTQRASSPKQPSRTIPRSVRRAVAERDGYQCGYVAADGRRCPSRFGLEFHHIRPYVKGGTATMENTSLRCKAHHRYQTALDFGVTAVHNAMVKSRLRRQGARPPSSAP